MKVLVIEDDPDIREEVLDWLTFDGYEAIGAVDGEEGVEMALQELPNLIICDIMMPKKDGHHVLLELRAHPATALIPFIFLTARTTRSDFRLGMELGAEDYLTKPFTHDEVLGAVRAQMNKAALVQYQTTHQMEQLRSTLIRTLPHELRTPLIGILGYAELMVLDADDLSPSRVREMAELIIASGQRLHRLIENYLTYSSIEMSAHDPERIARYQTAMLDNPDWLAGLFAQKVAHRHNRSEDLRLDTQPTRIFIRMNQADFQTVITELVDNAFKFSPRPSPVTLETRLTTAGYQIRIMDQGHGMSPEAIAQIGGFMQFDRKRHEQQGSGLGLIIAKRLIELYGGSLEIESRPNAGTSLVIRLMQATPP